MVEVGDILRNLMKMHFVIKLPLLSNFWMCALYSICQLDIHTTWRINSNSTYGPILLYHYYPMLWKM